MRYFRIVVAVAAAVAAAAAAALTVRACFTVFYSVLQQCTVFLYGLIVPYHAIVPSPIAVVLCLLNE